MSLRTIIAPNPGKDRASHYNPRSIMDNRIGCSLELLRRVPSKPTRRPALLFVHGAYVGAWCWDVHFLRHFAARGFPSYALSLRGMGRAHAKGTTRAFESTIMCMMSSAP